MKKIIIPLIIALIAAAGCRKSETSAFTGSYSFKTGGYLEISGTAYKLVKDDSGNLVPTPYDTSFTRNVAAESGQMHILSNSGDKVKLTLNITGGSPVVFDGSVNDGVLSLSPSERTITVIPDVSLNTQDILLLVSARATGRKFDNTIILDFVYEGNYRNGYIEGKIRKSNINCVAVRNE